MPSPRVALVDPSAFTPPYDRSLAAALARAGADVELLTSHFIYGPVPEADGYRVREAFYRRSSARGPGSRLRLPLKALEHVPGMLAARRRLAGFDVTHWQWTTLPALDRLLLGRRRAGHPRVLTLHPPIPPPGDRRGLAHRGLARRGLASLRRYLNAFDAVIVHTEGTARRLRDEVGLEPQRVETIPHGPLDYLTRLPEEAPLPAELAAAPADAPVILFFGLLRPYKGVDTLIEAFAHLGDRAAGGDPRRGEAAGEGGRRDAPARSGAPELWIAGMPRMPLEPLRELAARAPGTVRFLPRFVADPEIPALMRRADILALPYREIEQSGVLHAGMAFGKAMVLGDVGGFSEAGRRGTARLVPPGDAAALAATLAELIDQPGRRAELEDAARAAASGEQGWDAIAARTLDLYARLGAGAG